MGFENKLPNIVIFVPDSMRGDAISLDRKVNPIIETPNLDALAREGTAFTNCFSTNPVCTPSRCCTFTGQYIHSCSHRSLYQMLQPHEENLFKFLKNKGYEVIMIGRNDLFNKDALKESVTRRIKAKVKALKDNPFPKEHYLRKSFYYGLRNEDEAKDFDYSVIKAALKYLDSEPKEPFCLYIALNFPHPPYNVEEPYFSMYDREKIPNPIPKKLDDKPEFMQIMHERYGLYKLSKEDFKEIKATYYGMISRVDHQFGQIVDKVKEIGKYENTAFFFFSDHGDFTGDYGLIEKWPNAFHDCLLKVPLIMKIPGIHPINSVFTQLVQTIDIFPTILEIANIGTKYTHFGKSLIPLMKGNVKNIREAVFAEGGYDTREPQCFEDQIKSPDLPFIGIYYDKTNIPKEKPSTVARSVMIRTKSWKLVLRSNNEDELYDLMYDPIEINNLINIHGYEKIKINLKEQLLRWYLKTSDNPDWRRIRLI